MEDEILQESESVELGIKTAKRGAIYVSSKLFAAVITFILLIFLTRYLRPEYYGLYVIVVAFTSVLGMAGNFGLGTSSRKKLPESGDDVRRTAIASNTYLIGGIASIILTLIGILISPYIATEVYRNPSLTYPLIIASVTVFLTVMFNISNALLVGMDRVREAAAGNIAYSLAQLIFIVPLVLLGYSILGAVSGLAIGLMIGAIITFAFAARALGGKFIRPTKRVIGEMVHFSIPIMLSNVATTGIMNFAIDFLGVFVLASTVGSYGAAFKLARIFDVVLTSTTFILLPAFTKAISSKSLSNRISSIYDNSVFYMLLITLPILMFLVAASIPITDLLFSHAYSLSYIYFAIISIGITVQVIGSFAGTLIISYGDTKRFMRYQLLIVFTELILLAVLTPFIGVYGAIISLFVIGPIVMNIIYIRSLRSQFGVKLRAGRVARLSIASITLLVVMMTVGRYMHFSYYSILADIIVALLLYPPLINISGSINEGNIRFLRSLSERMSKAGRVLNPIIDYTELFLCKTTK